MPLIAVSILSNCNKTKTYHVKFTNGNEVIVAPTDPEPYVEEHKKYTFDAWYDEEFKIETGLTATKDYNFDAKFTSEDIV